MRLSYEEVLKEFAHHVGLESEALLHTEEVLIDGFPIGLQLEGSPVSGDVLFFTTLGTPSPEHLGRIARTLLEANNFWVGTGGCTLGVQQATGAVTLCVPGLPTNLNSMTVDVNVSRVNVTRVAAGRANCQ